MTVVHSDFFDVAGSSAGATAAGDTVGCGFDRAVCAITGSAVCFCFPFQIKTSWFGRDGLKMGEFFVLDWATSHLLNEDNLLKLLRQLGSRTWDMCISSVLCSWGSVSCGGDHDLWLKLYHYVVFSLLVFLPFGDWPGLVPPPADQQHGTRDLSAWDIITDDSFRPAECSAALFVRKPWNFVSVGIFCFLFVSGLISTVALILQFLL